MNWKKWVFGYLEAAVPIPAFSPDALERRKSFPRGRWGTPTLLSPVLLLTRMILSSNCCQAKVPRMLRCEGLRTALDWCYWER